MKPRGQAVEMWLYIWVQKQGNRAPSALMSCRLPLWCRCHRDCGRPWLWDSRFGCRMIIEWSKECSHGSGIFFLMARAAVVWWPCLCGHILLSGLYWPKGALDRFCVVSYWRVMAHDPWVIDDSYSASSSSCSLGASTPPMGPFLWVIVKSNSVSILSIGCL